MGSANSLRVVTWNIHGAVGRDRRVDDERVFAAIDRLAPDLLALQEIDGRTYLGRRAHAFERYVERLGANCAEARTQRGRTGRDFGHLLWSRWPIATARTHVLPGPGVETRMAIDAEIEAPCGRLRVLAVHLGLLPGIRRRQAAFLMGRVRAGAAPALFLGDTNEWDRHGGVDRSVRDRLPVRVMAPTFPSRAPFVAMDRIYAARRFTLSRFEVDEGTAPASDHRALVADLHADRG